MDMVRRKLIWSLLGLKGLSKILLKTTKDVSPVDHGLLFCLFVKVHSRSQIKNYTRNKEMFFPSDFDRSETRLFAEFSFHS